MRILKVSAVTQGWGMAPLFLAGLLAIAGCSLHYDMGRALEGKNRWEEAAIEYHLALIEDPEDEDFQEAVARADKVVARQNMERYRTYLAQKKFRKAYRRLLAASRQDPDLADVGEALKKWQRVLVGGQIVFELNQLQSNLSLAAEIKLVVRLNSPNPGEIIEAEIDINTGQFLAQDLLYDRPLALQTYYTINSIGVSLVHGRTAVKQFTNREYVRFINFRTPVLDSIQGELSINGAEGLHPIVQHRSKLEDSYQFKAVRSPRANPHYSMRLDQNRIHVRTKDAGGLYTPRYLYLNRKSRRLFVDFGRYKVQQLDLANQWKIERLPLKGEDYFENISKIIALQPYFFYREGVYAYVDVPAGS